MIEARTTRIRLLIIQEVQEDDSGATLRIQEGVQGRLARGDANYESHLRLARRSLEGQHPVGVRFGEGQTIVELIRADNDVPTELCENGRDARVFFQGHDGVFCLDASHPESARLRALLNSAIRQKARLWFIVQKPKLDLLDMLQEKGEVTQMSNTDNQQDTSKYADTSEFALWEKYESVAMHFNELIIRLRTQALGALAGVVALSGLAINFAQKAESKVQWWILFGTLLFFVFAWIALWILDMLYYDKLLGGAVKALLEHEQKTKLADSADFRINLSTKISDEFKNRKRPEDTNRHRRVIHRFYALVLIGLIIGLAYTGYQAIKSKDSNTDIIEYKIRLVPPERVKEGDQPAGQSVNPK